MASKKSGVIKYNVRDRGRKHRGQDRNFDTAALATLINGGAVQEKVKHRDMVGYFGHWPRIKFGMNPSEGGIIGGKAVAIEPAIVTTYLKAYSDGTIEHETEFLDTATGKMAKRLFDSQSGGFSSAIDTRRVADKQMPTGFYGFDYVLEPNFTQNRGYAVALDGVMDDETVMDAVAEYQFMFDTVNRMFDDLQGAYDRQQETLAHMVLEREELYSMLAKGGAHGKEVVLDGLRNVVIGKTTGRLFDADNFLNEKLIQVEIPESKNRVPDAAEDHLERQFGRK